MTNKEVDSLSNLLSKSAVGENNDVLSFEGLGLKLDDEASGEILIFLKLRFTGFL